MLVTETEEEEEEIEEEEDDDEEEVEVSDVEELVDILCNFVFWEVHDDMSHRESFESQFCK